MAISSSRNCFRSVLLKRTRREAGFAGAGDAGRAGGGGGGAAGAFAFAGAGFFDATAGTAFFTGVGFAGAAAFLGRGFALFTAGALDGLGATTFFTLFRTGAVFFAFILAIKHFFL